MLKHKNLGKTKNKKTILRDYWLDPPKSEKTKKTLMHLPPIYGNLWKTKNPGPMATPSVKMAVCNAVRNPQPAKI